MAAGEPLTTIYFICLTKNPLFLSNGIHDWINAKLFLFIITYDF